MKDLLQGNSTEWALLLPKSVDLTCLLALFAKFIWSNVDKFFITEILYQ